jgi:hypothetical protein
MSAYVVSPNTINAVVNAINGTGGQDGPSEMRSPFLNLNHRIFFDWTLFGQMLMDMNIAAVLQRYKDDLDMIPKEKYRFKSVRYPKIVSYKCMHCLIYQCSEGDVPEWPLFKALERAAAALAESIVCDLPEYNQAPWGL